MRTASERQRRRPGRRARLLRGFTAALLLLVLAFIAGGGWFYAGEIRAGALEAQPPDQPALEIEVLAAGSDSITLARGQTGQEQELTTDGVWGLRWAGGYGQVGSISEMDAGRVVRAFTRLRGTVPRPGTRVGLDGNAYPDDPGAALGVPWREVSYPSPLGPTPAWLVPGRRDTWVLFVHGYNAPRREALRMLGPVAAKGYPAMVLAYRNDQGAPRSPDRLRRWGLTEWRDLEAATGWALRHGAADVVLVGYSMGGAVVSSFLYESALAAKVRGVILDSPGLDLDAVVDRGARDRKLPLLGTPIPPPLTAVAKAIAGVRYDLDWDALDYPARASRLAAPVLLLQQDGDPTVPVAIAERLAAARPDLVTLERFDGAGHVRAWNVDRARYERAVGAFLDRVAPARPRSAA